MCDSYNIWHFPHANVAFGIVCTNDAMCCVILVKPINRVFACGRAEVHTHTQEKWLQANSHNCHFLNVCSVSVYVCMGDACIQPLLSCKPVDSWFFFFFLRKRIQNQNIQVRLSCIVQLVWVELRREWTSIEFFIRHLSIVRACACECVWVCISFDSYVLAHSLFIYLFRLRPSH